MPEKSNTLFSFRVDKALLAEFQSFAKDEYSNTAVEIRRLMKQAIADRLQDTLDDQ
jgi:hypothetical protein